MNFGKKYNRDNRILADVGNLSDGEMNKYRSINDSGLTVIIPTIDKKNVRFY